MEPRSKDLASKATKETGQTSFDFDAGGSLELPADQPAPAKPFHCTTRFDELMSPQALIETFDAKFRRSTGKGVDRLNGFQFEANRKDDLIHASRKCLDGTYRFTPYLEVLKTKGRGSAPRMVSIPTIRDRVVLHQLKELLAEAFPECVPRNIAGSIIRKIAADLPTHSLDTTFAAGCDIKQFYDALHRSRLLAHIARAITDQRALKIIERSIVTPTVPPSTRRDDYAKYRSKKGVPQGLATSNIMAAIYVSEIDDGMKKLPVRYFRYVDDVLIYGTEQNVVRARKSFVARARLRGLTVHKDSGGKSHHTKITDEFRYLGYVFKGRKITVRPATVERLLASLAAKFSDFRHNTEKRLRKLDIGRLKEIFLLELNERITGAVKDNRRYGWVAYFSQITELSLLHQLDCVVRGLFRRLPEFDRSSPKELKSFARAFFEMKYRPKAGYVRDFDVIQTRAEKIQFLFKRGRVEENEQLTDEQINDRFERYMNRVLSVMQADEASIY